MTPFYASPEQISGTQVGLASDVYSLGMVLYELLAGRRPFVASSQQDFEVAMAVMLQTPTRPSNRIKSDESHDPHRVKQISADEIASNRSTTPKQLRRRLRGDLDNIVLMAIRKEPDRRYASPADLANDIQRTFDRLPVTARRDSLGYVVSRLVQRNPLSVALSVLLLLALTVGSGMISRAWKSFAVERNLRMMDTLYRNEDYLSLMPYLENALAENPDNAHLKTMLERASRLVSIGSHPAGAEVSIRSAEDPTQEWRGIGTTPLQDFRIPKGKYQWKVSKDGYEHAYALKTANPPHEFVLLPENEDRDATQVPVPAHETNAIPRIRLGKVRLGQFLLDRYEVTNVRYQEFVDAGGYQSHNSEHWPEIVDVNGRVIPFDEAMEQFKDSTGEYGPASWRNGRYPAGEGHFPVRGVSWYEASAFASFNDMTLPTIRHWKTACDPNNFPFVAPHSNVGAKQNGPARVGQFQGIGKYGTFDMAGNVKEWCINPAGAGRRYILGGSWHEPIYRANGMDSFPPIDRREDFGFRCMKSSEPIPVHLAKEIILHTRDYRKIKPCSDEQLEEYLQAYAFERSKPLDVDQVESTKTITAVGGDTFLRQVVKFKPAYADDPMTGYLFLPKPHQATQPYQTVIYFPGSYAADMNALPEEWAAEWASGLISGGRAVFYPTYWGTYDRNRGQFASVWPEETDEYRDAITKVAQDVNRSVDYLATRDDIDANKLSFYGYSWGAALAPIILATEDRFKAAVLNCGGLNPQPCHPAVDPFNFIPRVKAAVLMINGRNDPVFPEELAQRPMFDLFDLPRRRKKHVFLGEKGHSILPVQATDAAEEWLNEILGRPDGM